MSTNNPYEIWEYDNPIELNGLTIFEFILQKASLSPSAHNTQSWEYELDDKMVNVHLDSRIELHYSDPKKRQAYLSLGCFVGSIIFLCDIFKICYNLDFVTDKNNYLIVQIKFGYYDNKAVYNNENLILLHNRRSNRYSYKDDVVTKDILTQTIPFSLYKGINIDFIQEDGQLDIIKNCILNAMEKAFHDKEFRVELSKWIRPSNKKYEDGMPGFTLNIPKPMSYLIPYMLRNFDITNLMMLENKKIVQKTPVIAIMSIDSSEDIFINWVKAGINSQQSFLLATKLGLSTQVLNAAIESEIYSKKIKNELSIKGDLLMIWRLGYSSKIPPHSPRRIIK